MEAILMHSASISTVLFNNVMFYMHLSFVQLDMKVLARRRSLTTSPK